MDVITTLLKKIRSCRECEKHLPYGPRPIVSFSKESRILIVGQAPGRRVHKTGIPWDDPSGNRLREWMGVDRETFYDSKKSRWFQWDFATQALENREISRLEKSARLFGMRKFLASC